MTDLLSQIGIVSWGCKGGCRVFCDNHVVDVNELEIHQTLKDIRSFITISRPGTDFYAVEFTSKYKVFTQYRSSNDSGNGAFTAFTIYVPHKVKIVNMRVLLNEMMNIYFKEFMNPLTFFPLSGKYDDINKYVAVLKEHADSVQIDKSHVFYAASKQDDRPQIVKYADDSAVDAYFASPYRPEFFECQEVMFLSADIVDNPTKYEVNFLVSPQIIAKVSEPTPESVVKLSAAGAAFGIKRFAVNGEDFTASEQPVPLSSADVVSMRVEAPYHTPKEWNDVPIDQLVADGILRRRGRDYEVNTSFRLDPIGYFLAIVATGIDAKDLDNHLVLSSRLGTKTVTREKNGQYGFSFIGDEVASEYALDFYISEFRDAASADKSTRMTLETVKPCDRFQNNQPLTHAFSKQVLAFKFPEDKPGAIDLKITSPQLASPIVMKSISFSFLGLSKEYAVLLPVKVAEGVVFEPMAKGYDTNVDNGVYVMTPCYKTVVWKVRGRLLDTFDDMGIPAVNFVSQAGNEIKGNKKGDNYEFVMPYATSLAGGSLNIRGIKFPVSADGKNITIKASLVRNKAKQALKVKVLLPGTAEDAAKETDLESRKYLLYPEGTIFDLLETDQENFKLKELGERDGVCVYDVEERVKQRTETEKPIVVIGTDVDKPKQDGQDQDHEKWMPRPTPDPDPKPESEPKPIIRTITLINCDNLYVKLKSGYSQIGTLQSKVRNHKKSTYKIYGKKQEELCVVKFPRQEYEADPVADAENRERGFTVEWQSDSACTVTYAPINFISRLKGFFDKRMLYGLLAVIVLAAVGLGAYYLMGGSKQPQMVLSFITKDSTAIKAIEANLSGIDFSQKEGTLTLVKPKESVADVNAILQDSVTLKFDADGTYKNTLGGLLGSNVNKFRTFFDRKQTEDGQATDETVEITVQSPGEMAVDELLNSELEIIPLIKACAEAAEKYPKQESDFVVIAYDGALVNLSDSVLKVYEDNAKYLNEDSLASLRSALNDIKAAESETEYLSNKLNSLVGKLATINCTKNDVVDLENFLKDNKDLSTPTLVKKISDYKKFFNYPAAPIYGQISQSSFSNPQWKLILYLFANDKLISRDLQNKKESLSFQYLNNKMNPKK